MGIILCEVIFGKVDTCHCQRALANVVLIPSESYISKYLLIINCMAVKVLHQLFYYHSKYLNSVKCQEISMDPYKCTIQCKTNNYVGLQKNSSLD
jgi:hypothetical protein